MTARLAVDIGGTFTDVVLEANGQLSTTKVLTTYADPAQAVMDGVEQVLHTSETDPGEISLVLHGTTLATNALIERRGAPTALLTTAGHRDALEMAFENRFEQYDVNIDRPAPLVPRAWRVGIDERHAADGAELKPLDEQQVVDAVGRLVEAGVESIAVGYLHSYAAPDHELRTADLIDANFPALSVSLSSRVCPEIREYERLSTTVANAYVKPLMSRYLTSLSNQLSARGIDCGLLLMTSGGGLTTLDAARQFPIRMVESGPAGGAILAAQIARDNGLGEVLSFDMGGTTAKICLIDDGEPLHSRSFEVDRAYRFKKGSGLPVRIPVIEMVEIGAGGGSIATVDAMRRVAVGPESAGSEPGPACYGRGGRGATVTDADVVLGRLAPDFFAGGSMRLDVGAARAAVVQGVGMPLELTEADAAFTIAEVVDENMAAAARAHGSEWGKSIAGRTMVAFGGAAPLHAANLARKLKIRELLVPAGAGVGSALGFLLAPVKFEVVRSHYALLSELDDETVASLFDDMRIEAGSIVRGAVPDAELGEVMQAFMRYRGQGYEVAVPLDEPVTDGLRSQFERTYAALYGRTIPGMEIEVLSWTLAVSAGTPERFRSLEASQKTADAEVGVIAFYDGDLRDARVIDRLGLGVGDRVSGPCLVAESQTTSVIPAGAIAEVLSDGTLKILLDGF
jgi:N-methylhydantoinase A